MHARFPDRYTESWMPQSERTCASCQHSHQANRHVDSRRPAATVTDITIAVRLGWFAGGTVVYDLHTTWRPP